MPKKRRGPGPTGEATPVLVRLHDDMLARLDAWRGEQPDNPSRPEAVRRILGDRLWGQPPVIQRKIEDPKF
jgi:hypothetical protein